MDQQVSQVLLGIVVLFVVLWGFYYFVFIWSGKASDKALDTFTSAIKVVTAIKHGKDAFEIEDIERDLKSLVIATTGLEHSIVEQTIKAIKSNQSHSSGRELLERFEGKDALDMISVLGALDKKREALPELDIEQVSQGLNQLFSWLPKHYLSPGSGLLRDYLDDGVFPPAIYNALAKISIGPGIPEAMRTEHMHIVAGSGQGKSQLIQNMVLDDLERDCSIVVIDSQGDLVSKLASVVPEDRMILVDPDTCPPSLNIFANQANSQREIMTAIDLYEYIFSALDVKMTSKQATVYRFVSRFLMVIPGATIHTMRELLEEGGLARYREHLDKLGTTPRAFFENEYDNAKQYGDTRREVLRRLYTVLENDALSLMLGASTNKIDMKDALDGGKVLLINTNKDYLKQTGSSLFGRIFLSLVLQAVMARQEGERKRVYLYIDEAQDYAEDSHVLFNMFEQGRKYGLGIIWAHQYLGQLPEQLSKSISANTAIKFAGGVSAQDARTLAGQMRTSHEVIDSQPKGSFLASVKGHGVISWPVELGRLEKLPRASRGEVEGIRRRMRERYGPDEVHRNAPTSPPAVQSDPPPGEDRW